MTKWEETVVVETVGSLVSKPGLLLSRIPLSFGRNEMHRHTFSLRPGLNNALPSSRKEIAK